MNPDRLFMAAAAMLLIFTAPAGAHQVSHMEHTHAYQQIGYGKYRQGHAVNGPYGNIIIWSARPYTGYQNSNRVRFARPVLLKKAPSGPVLESGAGSDAARNYGKQYKRDYGN